MDRSSAFLRIAKVLHEHPVFLYDRRGYARSPLRVHESLPGFSAHVADLHAVIGFCTEMTGRAPLLVGHSLGGTIALVAAAEGSSSLDGLIIFESPLLWESWWPQNPALVSGGQDDPISEAEQSRRFAESFMRRVLGDKKWDELPERTRVRRLDEGRVLRRELETGRSVGPLRFDSIGIPVLVSLGSGADPVRVRAAETLVAQIPSASMVVVDGAAHNLHTSDPERFSSLVRSFRTEAVTDSTSIP